VDEDKTAAQAELLYNRLSKRHRHLRKWARRSLINSFRLYDRDIPEIPLVLDLYEDAVSGALYKRPYEKDIHEEEIWLNAMKAAVVRALDIPGDRIFLKERRRMKDGQYEKLSVKNFYRDAREGDLAFRVNLSDYLDTGLFLDARKKRTLIREGAAGKRLLNLFAYTATLSVCAAKGGAARVDSVDLSRTYLEWGKINFVLNGLEASYLEHEAFMRSRSEAGHTLIQSDVIKFIAQAARKGLRWDLILLDPPSFSNSKKMSGALDIQRDHRNLIHGCLSLLSPGGKLYFSSNAKGFALGDKDWPGFIIEDITNDLVDEDFKGKRIPNCYIFGGE